MERPHTQHAPPQAAPDIDDLPLFDLSLGGDEANAAVPLSPASAVKASVSEDVGRSLFPRLDSSRVVASSLLPAPAASSSASSSVPAFRRPSPAPVIIAAETKGHLSSSAGDLFATRLPLSSLEATVASAAFADRCEFEFDMLQQLACSPESKAQIFSEATTDPAMHQKNRFTNVIPTRRARVILPSTSSAPADSYINACLIPPLLEGCVQPCIATQAPLPHTAVDFWRMVWHDNVQLLVMVTKESEHDSRGMLMTKAHAYWPATPAVAPGTSAPADDLLPSSEFGSFTVTLLSTHVEADIIIRELTLTCADDPSSQMRHIHHLQYTAWPDFGLSDLSGFTRIFSLYRAIRTHLESTRDSAAAATADASSLVAFSVPPVIVHCSAGIGRSGVWIAVDSLLDFIAHRAASGTLSDAHIDVFQLVRDMRDCRHGMVQTLAQYQFVYRFVAACLREGLFNVSSSPVAPKAT